MDLVIQVNPAKNMSGRGTTTMAPDLVPKAMPSLSLRCKFGELAAAASKRKADCHTQERSDRDATPYKDIVKAGLWTSERYWSSALSDRLFNCVEEVLGSLEVGSEETLLCCSLLRLPERLEPDVAVETVADLDGNGIQPLADDVATREACRAAVRMKERRQRLGDRARGGRELHLATYH